MSEALQNRSRSYLFQLATSKNISLESRKKTLKSGISKNLRDNVPILVGIQVRRGDKVNNPHGWLVPPREYFTRAMEHFKKKFKKIYFVVASEDKNWAKANIVGKDVLLSSSPDDLLELALLTLCDHTIMSVGTFSWWAAFLAGGDVVYYKNHTRPNTRAGNVYNDDQFFLPHWKGMI